MYPETDFDRLGSRKSATGMQHGCRQTVHSSSPGVCSSAGTVKIIRKYTKEELARHYCCRTVRLLGGRSKGGGLHIHEGLQLLKRLGFNDATVAPPLGVPWVPRILQIEAARVCEPN